jgi:predicted nuclease of predicted toxin-antitoxin system
MRILVDVCAGYTTRDWLVLQGHDVAFVGDRDFSMDDRDVLAWAHSERRVLVTCDKDFGHLVTVEQMPHSGILLLPGVRLAERIALLTEVIGKHAAQLEAGAFITVRGGRMRVRRPGR